MGLYKGRDRVEGEEAKGEGFPELPRCFPYSGRARARERRTMRRGVATLSLLCVLGCGYFGWCRLRSPTNANLIIVVLDAARADHFGCYGYPRDTTPNIDLLARESVLFNSHYCQIPFTAPSTASLFTGQYPDTHWVIYPAWEHEEPQETMAAVMKERGFATALFSSTPCASPVMGVGTHFEEAYYRTRHLDAGPGFSPESLLLQFKAWLDEHADARFFAYVHFIPPHSPYEQPSDMTVLFADADPPGYDPVAFTPWRFEFPVYEGERRPDLAEPPPVREWLNLYDANLRYGDWAVGEVVETLRSRGLLDNTVLVVTSDHGEAFGEHGYIWHPQAIHQEVARIPLLVRLPGGRVRGTVDTPTQTIDILPTVCDLFHMPTPAGVQGASLSPLVTGTGEAGANHTVTMSFQPRKYMVRTERFGLLVYEDARWRAFYDLDADPEERRNVIGDWPEEAKRLHELFREYAQAQSRPPHAFLGGEAAPDEVPSHKGLSPAVREQLKALGYVR